MNLGFVSGRWAFREGGRIWVDAALGRLIDTLGARVGRLSVALSSMSQPLERYEHALALSERDFLPLPEMPSVVRGLRKSAACLPAIMEVERRSDVTIVQLPFTAPAALLAPLGPRVYQICADQRALVRQTEAYRGARGVAAQGLAAGIHALQRALCAAPRARIVAHGDELLRQYGAERGRSVVSASLFDAEIGSVGRRRPEDAPFRILYVGYLRQPKGIDVLVESYLRLLENRTDVELVIVGASQPEDHGYAARFAARMRELSASGRVRFLGPKPFGPELFQAYADADVLVLPSRSEGTPRVLVEARAFGCPVIASRVGGIPASVHDGVDGLLVPPGDVEALTKAIGAVADSPALRRRLVEAGYATARRSSMEAFADALLAEARLAQRANSAHVSSSARST